jgi:hypothetical protein
MALAAGAGYSKISPEPGDGDGVPDDGHCLMTAHVLR